VTTRDAGHESKLLQLINNVPIARIGKINRSESCRRASVRHNDVSDNSGSARHLAGTDGADLEIAFVEYPRCAGFFA